MEPHGHARGLLQRPINLLTHSAKHALDIYGTPSELEDISKEIAERGP